MPPALPERARRRVAGARFVLADVSALPFRTASFDGVVGSSVLHHLDPDTALPEIHRVLASDGRASFTEPNMLNPQVALQKNVPAVKRWAGDSPDESAFFIWDLASRFRRASFDVHVEPFDFLHPAVPSQLVRGISVVGRVLERAPLVRHLAGSLYVIARRRERTASAERQGDRAT